LAVQPAFDDALDTRHKQTNNTGMRAAPLFKNILGSGFETSAQNFKKFKKL